VESHTIETTFIAINLENPLLVLIRGHLPELFFGPVFLFVGICACSVAAIGRRRGFRVLLWFGLFIGMAGTRSLASTATTFGLAHDPAWPIRVSTFIDYFLVVPSTLFWAELSIGKLRRFMRWLAASGAVAGVLSVAWYAATGRPYRFIVVNSLVAIFMLLAIALVVVIPSLSRKYLVIQSRVLSIVVPLIAFAAVFPVASRALGREAPPYLVPISFTVWIIALGYVAVQRTFENERRLLTIESELETARQIQFSILPENVPALPRLRIAAGYHPMSTVAGDFYQFIELDDHHLGVLVADVSGHGVPAALIAAMMKTAVQTIVPCAHSPREVLQGLNRMLSWQGHDQFVTAAYLFIDTENYKARYSAAGHPALLLSRAGKLQRIESNGLVFGVAAEPEYPVREIELCPGDRLVLYTDGLIEPENAKGEAFGECKLEQVLLGSQMSRPSELMVKLLEEIRAWQPGSMAQQDDVTLIVVDVL
jgi:sigma-B regulation protein RsbU (phosphoserine phosphatase)